MIFEMDCKEFVTYISVDSAGLACLPGMSDDARVRLSAGRASASTLYDDPASRLSSIRGSASVFPDESLRSSMTRTSAPTAALLNQAVLASYSRLRLSRADSEQLLPHQLPPHVIELAAKKKPLQLSTMSTTKPAMVAMLAVAAYTLFGTLVFHFSAMRLRWSSAFYFAVSTTTTVGYGDIDPAKPLLYPNNTHDRHSAPYEPTEASLLLTALYIIGGVAVVGASLTLLMRAALQRQRGLCKRYSLLVSVFLWLLLLLVGACFAMQLEGWEFVESLYWAVVTASTVGYGTPTPVTQKGEIFAGVFMLIGVGATAALLSDLAAVPLQVRPSPNASSGPGPGPSRSANRILRPGLHSSLT